MIISSGTWMPSRAAVSRLTANSMSGISSTDSSDGGVPRRMLST
jgi:hypothetical protein